jgi:hypothetical protein
MCSTYRKASSGVKAAITWATAADSIHPQSKTKLVFTLLIVSYSGVQLWP